jgi:hypothetical protein
LGNRVHYTLVGFGVITVAGLMGQKWSRLATTMESVGMIALCISAAAILGLDPILPFNLRVDVSRNSADGAAILVGRCPLFASYGYFLPFL